jgi:hypothetical protein
MTDHKELIARLRELGIRSADEAADALEAMERERDEAVRLGRAGAYKATPEHSWAEWCADRQQCLDAAEARIVKLEQERDEARASLNALLSCSEYVLGVKISEAARAALEDKTNGQ